MNLRVATLNMEQDHKRWDKRRDLIVEALAAINPDLFAMNEVCIPPQTARWIQKTMITRGCGRNCDADTSDEVEARSTLPVRT